MMVTEIGSGLRRVAVGAGRNTFTGHWRVAGGAGQNT